MSCTAIKFLFTLVVLFLFPETNTDHHSMSLSQETLSPLTFRSFELSYCYTHPLKFIATRYTLSSSCSSNKPSPAGSTCTLLFVGGITLNQETWLPIIKSLYRLSYQSASVHIESAWTIERPNHGDASILNERALKEHYQTTFPSAEYVAAIKAFLASDLLTLQERRNLVAIGHSGGGGSVILSLDPVPADLPYRALILIEAPHCGYPAHPFFVALDKFVKESNQKRRRKWSSTEEGVNWLKKRLPWKNFHPDVIQIVSETYFRPDPEDPSAVIAKTTPEQETASFKHHRNNLKALSHIRSLYHRLPTHVIVGAIHDIWPEPVYQQIEENIAEDRGKLASVTVIEDGGHYIPVQMPERTAQEIYRILADTYKSKPRLPRL